MAWKNVLTAPFVLIDDNCDRNTLPLTVELVRSEQEKLYLFAYEQPLSLWKNVLRDYCPHIEYHNEVDLTKTSEYMSSKCTIMIDSVNQMSLCLGWNKCLIFLRSIILNPSIRLIVVLHRDCIPFHRVRSHLHHLASAIILYDDNDSTKITVTWKKSGKSFKNKELLCYDRGKLISTPMKDNQQELEDIETNINKIATFKIGLEENEKVERNKLELPYMNKIHNSQSKVHYEPDIVDDWDDEDPDDDLDI